ncbi:Lnb N-terminal periplasmic domain-containing protein [Acinetobacter guillouiae]|uniref:Uncharacterized protein n=2 Tax=Gammaproteobacteria TaxID=1236 RepID=N8Y700_ACIGI|nr:DUF4105 domain-containing protein [Acinetobacter guillouiae]ENV15085.1 hypothetical protein F964_03807 [Acinetobacter guillouiae NIPH 991]
MKYLALSLSLLSSLFTVHLHAESALENQHALENALKLAQQKQLAGHITWKRLLYAEDASAKDLNHHNTSHKSTNQSEVSYSGYFFAQDGRQNIQNEMNADITALFQVADANQSIRCKFPARSQWLIQQLNISQQQLPVVSCPEFDQWYAQIKPYQVTLIYATDFMGNPSSMFGHTLLRLDPKDQKQLNLVSYAVNYAATVNSDDNWSYAWKGLVGKYPGEYSLMPYYRKVKEYGDFESRDLWEYELNLNPEETAFLVKHIWEMQKVSFPYYFVSDNCAYRLLGLIDLVRPSSNLRKQFTYAAIPIETIKAVEQQGLVREAVYRPALETQLNSQAKQHGHALAKKAHAIAVLEPQQMQAAIAVYDDQDRAKILEMAYDDLYLQFVARQVDASFTQPRFRQLLGLRSQIPIEKQRLAPVRPKVDPVNGHDSRKWSVEAGEVQGEKFVQIGHRQAYHELKDPQGGFRTGTQLLFLDGAAQWRDDRLKLEHLDVLTVNSYNPITPFKMPITWGFTLGWQQEAIQNGQFSDQQQHGVVSAKAQSGYTIADDDRKHLCYAELQTQLQAGTSLDKGWRVGLGPTLGCQNVWSDRLNSIVQVELPYWQDSSEWNLRIQSTLQYSLNHQNSLNVNWEYQQQNQLDWQKIGLGFVHYF